MKEQISDLALKMASSHGTTHGFLFSVLIPGVAAGVEVAEVFVLSLLPPHHDFACVPGVGVEAALQTFMSTLSMH